MEVSDQIIKVLDNLGQKFGLAIDWTQSNIMPYIQQLGQKIVNYEFWTSVVWIVICLLVALGFGVMFKKSFDGYKKADYYENDGYIFLCVLSVIVMIACGIVIIIQSFDIVTCLTLPEKVWFDYINSYITRK